MKLRNYQQKAVEAIPAYFQKNKTGNPLIVCPTASGKSVIQAAFIKYAFQYPGQKWLLLSHVMELIDQNFERLMQFWPEAPAGVFCAKLKRKDRDCAITVASIQSIHRVAIHFGRIDGIVIDEAHLVSDEQSGMYRRLISTLMEINPRLRVIGLTATPFRLKTGMLTEGKNRLFTDIAFEIPISTMIRDGWIVPLKSKSSKHEADLSKVKTLAGDFKPDEMETIMNSEALTNEMLDEVIELGADRRSWLFFTSGVQHAYHVRDNLRDRGITAEVITGDTKEDERKRILADYKAYKIKAVLNYGCLTTGFDAPNIDLIILLRGTKSPGLYQQILGRGLRLLGQTLQQSIENGKADCLILDYAGNIKRFGPLNLIKPVVQGDYMKNQGDGVKRSPVKTCIVCYETQCVFNSKCIDCGYEFPKGNYQHDTTAASGDILSDDILQDSPIQNLNVDKVTYKNHLSKTGNYTLQVSYACGLSNINEYIGIEHPTIFRAAMTWWKSRAIDKYKDSPKTTAEAMTRLEDLKTPETIAVKRNKKYFEVVGVVKYKE